MDLILQKQFRESVLSLLEERQITKAELARLMGVTGPYVHIYLGGRQSPGLDVIERFAKALGVPPHELLLPAAVTV